MSERDEACENMAAELDVTLALQKVINQPQREPTGACYWCEEPAPIGAIFCSVECRDDEAKYYRSGR